MAVVQIHPAYRELLSRLGLARAAEFLRMSGVICCGHPDRNVSRLMLGDVRTFLKREHRTRWRDRLGNLVAGFGLVAKSRREFALLANLQADGIGCPEAIVCGEDGSRAFLLVRELQGYEDLRNYLQRLGAGQRRTVARQLAAAVAHFHAAGYEHRDLYAKHVLVNDSQGPEQLRFCFLDWQRGRKCKRVTASARWRDLATLDATLAEGLVSERVRAAALRVYLQMIGKTAIGQTMRVAANTIRGRALKLLQHRRIREMRQPPMESGKQNLIWLDGEALQVTKEYAKHFSNWKPPKKGTGFFFDVLPLPGKRDGHLVSRMARRPWRWLWSMLRRKPLIAPELESMKVLFRLERYGVVMPKLVAVGQKQIKPWTIQSFLLTEPLQNAAPLPVFLSGSETKARRKVIRQAARTLRQMHQATCYVQPSQYAQIGDLLSVTTQSAVAISTVHGIEKSHYPHPARAQRDLAAMVYALTQHCSRTDLLRGLLAYSGQKRLSFAGKLFARRVLRRGSTLQRQRRVAA